MPWSSTSIGSDTVHVSTPPTPSSKDTDRSFGSFALRVTVPVWEIFTLTSKSLTDPPSEPFSSPQFSSSPPRRYLTTSRCPLHAACMSGVMDRTPDRSFASHPHSMSARRHPVCPDRAANAAAVRSRASPPSQYPSTPPGLCGAILVSRFRTTFTWPAFAAAMTGVSPLCVGHVSSASAAPSSSATSREFRMASTMSPRPWNAARVTALAPTLSVATTLAPASRSASTAAMDPFAAAHISGVAPESARHSGHAPLDTRSFTLAASSSSAARSRCGESDWSNGAMNASTFSMPPLPRAALAERGLDGPALCHRCASGHFAFEARWPKSGGLESNEGFWRLYCRLDSCVILT